MLNVLNGIRDGRFVKDLEIEYSNDMSSLKDFDIKNEKRLLSVMQKSIESLFK